MFKHCVLSPDGNVVRINGDGGYTFFPLVSNIAVNKFFSLLVFNTLVVDFCNRVSSTLELLYLKIK